MNITPENISSTKSTIKLARRELNKFPLDNSKARKSSIPLQLRELLSNNNLSQIAPDALTKSSFKGNFSTKKKLLNDIINTSIPEVSENSSNNKDEKINKEKKHIKHIKENKHIKHIKEKKENKKEIEKNNYYIHYIKNVYENDPHFNKESIVNSTNKKINNHDIYSKFLEQNRNITPINWRRNSDYNKNFLKSNFKHINLILDKEQLNSKKAGSIINKKMSENNIGSFLRKKQLEEKQKEIIKLYINNNKNKSKHKHKEKSKHKVKDKEKEKEKDKDKDKEKDKDKDKDNENEEKNAINIVNIDENEHKKENDSMTKKENDSITKKERVRKKESLDNERKTVTENNMESIKIKSKVRKFLCCIINNGDSSIEND